MKKLKNKKSFFLTIVLVSFITSALVGFLGGGAAYQVSGKMQSSFLKKITPNLQKAPTDKTCQQSVKIVTQEEQVVKVVKQSSPSVVSIIITKDLPVLEKYYSNPFEKFFKQSPFGGDFFSPFEFKVPQYRQKGTRKQKIGGGTGFVVDSTGLIVTNRHVVADREADYTVLTNEGEKLDAKVLARHPSRDIAILKVDKKLPPLKLGDSDALKLGQTVIAIGNALGEFRNTVSKGVVSGLGRQVTAQGASGVERLTQVIQTDAAINHGNSGGPLLNLEGEVIGINTAMAQGAENIGFAIPINQVAASIAQVKETGELAIPFLGVRYVVINKLMAKQNNLPVDYGALIVKGNRPGQVAVVPGSPADKAGLEANDIILEMDGEKITSKNTLADIILKKKVGQKVTLKILHQGEEKTIEVKLSKRSG